MKRLAFICVLLFTVCAISQSQTITVTSPDGGEDWALGSTHNITWRSSGVSGNVTLLLLSGGDRVGVIQDNVPVAAGSFSWIVGNYQGGTAAPGTNYKVRIRKPQTEIMDSSNRPFTISGLTAREPTPTTARPMITVTSPNGGETWYTNVVHEVRWTSVGISGGVTIRLKKGGVAVRSWTADNTGSSYGSYSWAQAGTDYKIRVEDSTGSAFDESDRNFTIQTPAGPTPPPSAQSTRTRQMAEAEAKIPPRIISFSLNNGAEVVNDLMVTFNYQCLGGATHYRYRINPDWEDWQRIESGRQPYGYLLLFACEQTVYFQVKNEYGESNVVSDSIKTSVERTARTISIAEAMRYAGPQGFTSEVTWADCEDCALIVPDPNGVYMLMLGFQFPTERLMQGGMKADYELFGGNKLLKPGWEFVSFGMPEVVSVGNPDALDAQGVRISYQPPPGGRDIKLRVRLWRNILSGAVIFGVRTITLKGPCTEDVSEAFKQQ